MRAGDSRRMVLLVEDDPDTRALLATVLEDAGWRVRQAANGVEALTILTEEEGRCALVLLDLMMPVMNGWDFRRKQKANPALAGIPVLLMSAGAHIASAGGDLDAVGTVTKPVEIADLLAKVQPLGW
jgi:CheY-like chemotaxis protein